jgi:hypothetical protein
MLHRSFCGRVSTASSAMLRVTLHCVFVCLFIIEQPHAFISHPWLTQQAMPTLPRMLRP